MCKQLSFLLHKTGGLPSGKMNKWPWIAIEAIHGDVLSLHCFCGELLFFIISLLVFWHYGLPSRWPSQTVNQLTTQSVCQPAGQPVWPAAASRHVRHTEFSAGIQGAFSNYQPLRLCQNMQNLFSGHGAEKKSRKFSSAVLLNSLLNPWV